MANTGFLRVNTSERDDEGFLQGLSGGQRAAVGATAFVRTIQGNDGFTEAIALADKMAGAKKAMLQRQSTVGMLQGLAAGQSLEELLPKYGANLSLDDARGFINQKISEAAELEKEQRAEERHKRDAMLSSDLSTKAHIAQVQADRAATKAAEEQDAALRGQAKEAQTTVAEEPVTAQNVEGPIPGTSIVQSPKSLGSDEVMGYVAPLQEAQKERKDLATGFLQSGEGARAAEQARKFNAEVGQKEALGAAAQARAAGGGGTPPRTGEGAAIQGYLADNPGDYVGAAEVAATYRAKSAEDVTAGRTRGRTFALGSPEALEAIRRRSEVLADVTNKAMADRWMPTTFVDLKTGIPLMANSKREMKLANVEDNAVPASKPMGKDIQTGGEMQVMLDALDRIDKNFDPSYVGLSDAAWGYLQERTTGVPEEQVFFYADVNSIKDALLRAKSGAQINEDEYKRLVKLVPDQFLPDSVFRSRALRFRMELQSVITGRNRARTGRGLQDTEESSTTPANVPTTPQKDVDLDGSPAEVLRSLRGEP